MEKVAAHNRYCVIPQSVQQRVRRHPLCSVLYLTEIGFEEHTYFQPGTKRQEASQYLLVYVSKGSGSYGVGGKHFPVAEHDYFVLPVKDAPEMVSTAGTPWSIYWAYFTGTIAGNVFLHLMGKDLTPKRAKPLVGRVAQFNDILHHLELMENMENLVYANSRFYTFLCSFRLLVLSTRKFGKKDGVIQSMEYMREHIGGQITLEDLAGVAGLSVSHYCAVFKQKTMQTPLQLFTSMKIQRACQLLQSKNLTIKAIAYQLGFFDQYHFSKVFKQVMGVAPKNFRSSSGKSAG
jgi:AraC-like DNA-binding protein